MKKKGENFYLSGLKYLFFCGLSYLIQRYFKVEIDYFFENTPKIYFTIGLFLLLIYSLIAPLFKQTKKNNIALFISCDNDYNQKDTSLGMIVLIIIGTFVYYYFAETFEANALIITAILLSWTVQGYYAVNKSANFKLINGKLHFNNGKENRFFAIKNIDEIKISKDEIKIVGENLNQLIHFIKIKDGDFKEMKLWFNKRLPYIEITKFNL